MTDLNKNFTKGDRAAITAIIPTYNRGHLITRAIESVLYQEGDFDVEVIIVDDGSTDDTREKVLQMDDERIRFFQISHQGACAARNYGLEMASGDYIAFQDSDNVWHRDKLAKQLKLLHEKKADVVCCAYQYHDLTENVHAVIPSCRQEGQIDFDRIIAGNLMDTCTIFGRKECMKQTRFDPQLPRWQDWDYALQLTRKWIVYFSPEVLVEEYIQNDSITKKPNLAVDAACILLRRYREAFFTSGDSLEGMLHLLQMSKNQMFDMINNQRNQIRTEQAEMAQLQKAVQRLEEERRNVDNTLRDVLDSRAWKIGRIVTFIPRRLHDWLRKKEKMLHKNEFFSKKL